MATRKLPPLVREVSSIYDNSYLSPPRSNRGHSCAKAFKTVADSPIREKRSYIVRCTKLKSIGVKITLSPKDRRRGEKRAASITMDQAADGTSEAFCQTSSVQEKLGMITPLPSLFAQRLPGVRLARRL